MMRSILFLPILLFCAFLSACQTGGYGAKNWEFNRAPPVPAESAPSPIADIKEIEQPQTPAKAQQVPPIVVPATKVAILVPLSGKNKTLGDSMLKAAQIALFDIGGQSFELVPVDTQGTPGGAAAAAENAVRQGAQLILGPLFAGSVRAVQPIARRANVNMIAFSTDWSLADRGTFILGFLPFDQVERLTRYVAASNMRRVGVFAPSSAYGRAVADAFEGLATRYGVQVPARESFPPSSANLAPQLRQFTNYDARKADPQALSPFDAVLMPVGGEQASAIANLLTHYDLPPSQVKRLGTGLLDNKSLAAEPALNGTWFAAPSPRLRRDFEQKFLGAYGYNAPRLATLAYDATALAAVLARQGDLSRNAITNPNGFYGIDGIFRFRPDGTAERGLAILELRRGQIVEIDPAPTTFEQNNL